MGVKNLWSIFDSTSQQGSSDDLLGKTIAIDLSIWIIESRSVSSNQHRNSLHLRTLFFRVLNLIYFNIKPIFVLDSTKMTDLKFDSFVKRCPTIDINRTNFNHLIDECSQLLTYLGLPIIRADGEAEKLCAQLNRMNIVDVVITNDSDCLVYGAKTILRNFAIDTKSITFDRYDRNEIGLTQRQLIVLALLLGSDYDRQGLIGVGRETSMKYLQSIPKEFDPIEYLRTTLKRSEPSNKIQQRIYNLIKENPSILKQFDRIIDEYLSNPSETFSTISSTIKNKWLKPVRLKELQRLMKKKLAWIDSYTLNKVFPLLTRFQILYRLNQIELDVNDVLSLSEMKIYQPSKIDKIRFRHGKEFYQVEWKRPDESIEEQIENLSLIVVENDDDEEKFVTIEPADPFRHAYPEIVQEFEAPKTKKTKITTTTTTNQRKKKNQPASTSMSLDLLSMIEEKIPEKRFLHRPSMAAFSTSMSIDVLSVLQKPSETSRTLTRHPRSDLTSSQSRTESSDVQLVNTSLSLDVLDILLRDQSPTTTSDYVLPLPLWQRIRQRRAGEFSS